MNATHWWWNVFKRWGGGGGGGGGMGHQKHYAAKSLQRGAHAPGNPPSRDYRHQNPDWMISIAQVCSVETPQDPASTLYCLYMNQMEHQKKIMTFLFTTNL